LENYETNFFLIRFKQITLTSSQIQVYSKENNNIPPVIYRLNDVEAIGPSSGNLMRYNTDMIPKNKAAHPQTRILSLLLKLKNAIPIPTPSKPVVNGNTMSSLGCNINKRNTVEKYESIPSRIDIIEQIIIGAVESGLMNNPIIGINPPADWKTVAKQHNKETTTKRQVKEYRLAFS